MINFGTNILLLSSGNQLIFVKTHAQTHMHIYSYMISMYLTLSISVITEIYTLMRYI